jgi:hypothetical protein
MPLREDFISQAKRCNWTFNLGKSSLGPLVQTLIPAYNPVYVAQEVVRLPDGKKKKYRKALTWLEGRIPPLEGLIEAHSQGTGLTDQIYAPGKQVRLKDSDNRHYDFELQEKGNSCGCSAVHSVLMAFTHLRQPSEQEIRDDMSLCESGIAHQGVTKSNHDWERVGSVVPSVVSVLISYGVTSARTVVGHPACLDGLKNCSKNTPGIIGWYWGTFGDTTRGGHWTVCVGPSKDGTRLVLLDPWNGVQYVDTARYWEYVVDNGTRGWFSPRDTSFPVVVVTYPK